MRVVVIIGPYAKGFLFVDIGLAHGHGDWEDGDVHHDQVADLNGRMEISDVDNGESGSTGCSRLEEAVKEAESGWKDGNGRIIKLYRVSNKQAMVQESGLRQE